MAFSCDEIRQLKNPYQDLHSSDTLAEHREELDKLSPEEMTDLASRMILACPQAELSHFGLAINALRASAKEGESFHTVLYNAYEVRKRIQALSDPANKNPHSLLLGSEFNADLFNNFQELTLELVDKNESDITTRLALTTPEESRHQLAVNIRNIFPNTVLAIKTGQAFTLRREIDRLLLGDKPGDFFTSRDFNVDLCLEFSSLFSSLVHGQEQAIGAKLAVLEDKVRHDIHRKLELLNPKAKDTHSPFRAIAAAMTPKTEPKPITEIAAPKPGSAETKASPGSSLKIFGPTTSKSGLISSTTVDNDDDEDDKNCVSSFCGLFK